MQADRHTHRQTDRQTDTSTDIRTCCTASSQLKILTYDETKSYLNIDEQMYIPKCMIFQHLDTT